MMKSKYFFLIFLLTILTLLLSAFAANLPLASVSAVTNEDGWITSTDTAYNFSFSHPQDWSLQPYPYIDWGWRLSSPDAQVDVMGRPTRGAFLSLYVVELEAFDPDSYQMPYYHYVVSEEKTLQPAEGQAWEISGNSAYSSQFIDYLHYINGYLYHFSFQCSTSDCADYLPLGQQILKSIAIMGAPTNEHQIAFEESAVVFEDFSFPALKHGFPAGEGRFTGDYDGPNHTGGDDYAIDSIACDGAYSGSCWHGMVGQIVLAQTDMKYVYTADANNNPDDPHDFHFFDLGLYGDKRYCMSYGHIYVYGIEVGDEITQGAVVGVLSEYMTAAPHIHMGVYWVYGSESDPEFQCARWVTRHALPYTGDFALDGVEYPVGLDFQGDMTTSTNDGYCLGDPENPPADLRSCIQQPSAPTALTPSGDIFTRRPAFTWTKDAAATEYHLVVELTSDPANLIDVWVDAEDICGETTCSYTHSSDLNLDRHVWAVQARNILSTSSYSNSKVFNIVTDDIPPRPTITSPSGQISDVTPTYTWEDQQEAEDFRLYVSHVTTGVVIHDWYLADDVCTDGTCEVEHPTHLRTGNHAWYIQSRNPNGGSELWSIPLSFKLLNTTPPDEAIIPVSPTGGEVVSVTPTYTWNAVERASWYKVFIGSQTTGKVYNAYHRATEVCYGETCEITPAEYLLSGTPSASLAYDTIHNWYVMPVNVAGNGNWSAAQKFRTEAVP